MRAELERGHLARVCKPGRHGVAAVRAKLERGRLAQACKPGRHYLKGIKKSLLQSLSKEVRGRPMLTFLRKQWNRNGYLLTKRISVCDKRRHYRRLHHTHEIKEFGREET
ncbi:uncharacterized protein LOC124671976 isoform X1 [Lolium rigidum]|uniref:uncharacterized protein LOC124671976 isoform X1 n=1 Tax=Lolium rigidum TaxID=89674 RepID=UPI001F5C2AFE|nr:uncharacterized protein LOC124671976 isoform X1 [Lolium rigidum]